MIQNLDEYVDQLVRLENDARPSEEHIRLARLILNRINIDPANEIVCSLSYFLRYGYIPISSNSSSEIGKFIGSAPWVGLEGETLFESIETLKSKNIISFYKIPELDNQFCIGLNFSLVHSDEWLNRLFAKLWLKTSNQIQRRCQIIENYDWTHGKKIQNEMRQIIKNAPNGGVIKILAYHGRTWLPSSNGVLGFLLDTVNTRSDLSFKILVIDPNASGRVIEGGTPEANNRASSLILSVIKNTHLSTKTLSKFDIRTYGKIENESYMRGLIVETNDGRIVSCFITTWFFGSDRGFYGREIKLDGDSSLALLVRNYFNSVFEKSKPQLNRVQQFYWYIRLYWFRLLTLVVIPLIFIIVFLYDSSQKFALSIIIGSLVSGFSSLFSRK